MQLSLEVVRLFMESKEEFPVELDDAWKWLGFRRKEAAKLLLLDAFIEGLDFFRGPGKATGGRPSEVFMLTVDCFKSLGMMANTEKGREVRKYFLECERQLKELMRSRYTEQPPSPTTPRGTPKPAALPPNSFMSTELSPDNELYQLFREAGKREIIRKFLVS